MRHLVFDRLSVYLFPPFGLSPSPGWNNRFVREDRSIAAIGHPDVVLLTPQVTCFWSGLVAQESALDWDDPIDGSSVLTRATISRQGCQASVASPGYRLVWVTVKTSGAAGGMQASKGRGGLPPHSEVWAWQ